MSILDNEGHDPNGFGNTSAYRDTRDKIAAAREKQLAEALAEVARLQKIIDSRPAINAGLPGTYIKWSNSIYELEAVRALKIQS